MGEEREHHLKTWPECFEAIIEGRKSFEVRINDRGFKEGDYLLLLEFTLHNQNFTGRRIKAKITYICELPQMENLVGMQIEKIGDVETQMR